jgi:nucleoside-diphosphate-sugar epimerase
VRARMQSLGYAATDFSEASLPPVLTGSTHLLISTPLNKQWNDPVLEQFKFLIEANKASLEWIGYLSTTGVYGDHKGAWVDESTPPRPDNARLSGRISAETGWLELGAALGVATCVFRLAGIYGPGRNAIRQLKDGNARPIYKKDQVFSRIHVEDIAQVLHASMLHPATGIYNVCDDDPAPSHEIIAYAAQLLHMAAPALIPFEQAEMSEMAREFYSSNRRVNNARMKQGLGVSLRYPTFREGLSALLTQEH